MSTVLGFLASHGLAIGYLATVIVAAIATLFVIRRYFWELLIWYTPASILAGIGIAAGFWGAGLGLGLLWLTVVWVKGLVINKQQEFVVYERNGKYHRVLFRGWYLTVIGVDRPRFRGDLRATSYELYADDPGTEIDFTDGVSAPVVVKIWYRFGRAVDAVLAHENWTALTEAILLAVYGYDDYKGRIYDLADGALRPRLQAMSSDEAAVQRNGIANDTIAAIAGSLADMGIYAPANEQLVIIEDIALKPEDIAARRKTLEGERIAQREAEIAAGTARSITAIRDPLGVSTTEATRIYLQVRGLEALEKVPNLTLLGKNLNQVLAALGIGRN